MIVVAWALDLVARGVGDFGFWLHLFGAITLWGALAVSEARPAFGKALFCAINVGFIALGLFLNRRIYAVLGVIGVASYLGYLASDVFKDMRQFSLRAVGDRPGDHLPRRRPATSPTPINAAIEKPCRRALRALRPARGLKCLTKKKRERELTK